MTKAEFSDQFKEVPFDKQWDFLLSIPKEDRHRVVFHLDNDVSWVYWDDGGTSSIPANRLCSCLYNDDGVFALLRALGFTAEFV